MLNSQFLAAVVFQHILELPLPVTEKVVRPILVYLFLVFLLRVFGKRELAQLNPLDLVVLLSLSNTVQNAIIGDDSSVTGGFIGAFTLLSVNYLVVRFLFKHRRLDQLVEGKPSVLIEHGKIKKGALAKELLSLSKLQTVAHRQGFLSLKEIDSLVLEPGGSFFIQAKAPPLEEERHKEVLQRIEMLSRQIEELRLQRS